jgi:hypothetical protein
MQNSITEAARESGISEYMLEAAVARDFGEWVKHERLPKPPKPS